MSCGTHDHGSSAKEQPAPPGDGPHAGHNAHAEASVAPAAAIGWERIARSPTAWLLGAFLVVAAHFALSGSAARIWSVLPYFAVVWMLLHHLGGHGGHGSGGGAGGHRH